jgi:hypothetical protein
MSVETNEPLEYEIDVCSLGNFINTISLLISTGRPVHLKALAATSALAHDIKRIMMIPDSVLTITDQDTVTDPIIGSHLETHRVSDYCKFWSPYISPETIQVFGNQYPTGRQGKPCIGISTGVWTNDPERLEFRFYDSDFWKDIIDLIRSANYEIITLDQKSLNIEQKCFVINELCDAVIGYEGGVSHLAHVLRVPSIIMPWHCNESGLVSDGLDLVPHKMHVDPKTWFVKSTKEILGWKYWNLQHKIQQLHNNKGNNFFLTHTFNSDSKTLSGPNVAYFRPWERQFILDHVPDPVVGGINKNIVN